MDTDLLKTFLEVARTRHFGKAADNLFLTRSAVSFRVKQLESVLGVALFARQRNNIQLTSAGERMLVHAEAILTAWERAKQDISLSNEQSIQLAIGAVPNIWGAYLQPVLQPLHQALSGVALRTEELPHSVMSRQLLARMLDVMISFDAPQMDELEHIKLGEVELCLVSGAGDISLADVGQYPYVKVNWGTAFNIQHARDFVGLPLPSMHTGSAAMALDFVLNNQAAAFLPHHLIQDGLAQGKLHLVQDAASLSRSVYLGYWGQNDRLAIIQSAIGVLQQKAAL